MIQTALKTWDGVYHANVDPAAPHEAGLLMLAIDKARNQLGWQPKWDFETAVATTMHWYKQSADGAAALGITSDQIKAYEAA